MFTIMEKGIYTQQKQGKQGVGVDIFDNLGHLSGVGRNGVMMGG